METRQTKEQLLNGQLSQTRPAHAAAATLCQQLVEHKTSSWAWFKHTKNRLSSVGKTLIPELSPVEQAQNIDSGLVQKTPNFELILVGWVASCVAA